MLLQDAARGQRASPVSNVSSKRRARCDLPAPEIGAILATHRGQLHRLRTDIAQVQNFAGYLTYC